MPIKFKKCAENDKTEDVYFVKKKKLSNVESLPSLSRNKRSGVGQI